MGAPLLGLAKSVYYNRTYYEHLLSPNESTSNQIRMKNLFPVEIFSGDVISKFHIREGYQASVVLEQENFREEGVFSK